MKTFLITSPIAILIGKNAKSSTQLDYAIYMPGEEVELSDGQSRDNHASIELIKTKTKPSKKGNNHGN